MTADAALKQELKELIVEALALDDVTPQEIGDDEPLLFIGAGLDSIDILELIMLLRRNYGVEFEEDGDVIKELFQDINSLAAFIAQNREK
ncbi:MAG TPA: acyl carrier protein [Myxococcales bacterium]|nr:acyl carrier protein [Deltaproteobacteria bacterium]HAA56000.1 acyl carrier protein [Myxococcales bacterium]|tara:strand:- start:7588 stop:7857 length:270 start_codon:yes stop_codon:yes gene_type:complete